MKLLTLPSILIGLTLSASAQVIKVTETSGDTNTYAGQTKQIGEHIRAKNGEANGSYDYQGGKWVLFPHSSFVLQTAGECADGGRVSFFEINGIMEWRFPKHFLKECSTVRFKTQEATYKIGGTAFRIDSKKGVTLLGTSSGVVTSKAQGQTQYVAGGYYNTTKAGEPPSPPRLIQPLTLKYIGRPSAGAQKVMIAEGNQIKIGEELLSGNIALPIGIEATAIAPDGSTKAVTVEPQWHF